MASADPHYTTIEELEDGPLSQEIPDFTCSACARNDKHAQAVKYCSLCKDSFCEICSNFHDSFKVTIKHKGYVKDLHHLGRNIKRETEPRSTVHADIGAKYKAIHIQNLRWFHPKITKHDAELILNKHGMDRRYLACRDESDTGFIILTIRKKRTKITHLRVEISNDKFLGPFGRTFSTAEELLTYHLSRCDVSDGCVENYRPLNYEDTITERWFHRDVSSKTAKRLLLKNGRPGSYLLCESKSTPGNFTLAIKLDEKKVEYASIKRENSKFVLDMANSSLYETIYDVMDAFRKRDVFIPGVTAADALYAFKGTCFLARDVSGRIEQLSKDKCINQLGKVYGDGFTEEVDALAKEYKLNVSTSQQQQQSSPNEAVSKGQALLRVKTVIGKETNISGERESGNQADSCLVTGLIKGGQTSQRRYVVCRGCTVDTEAAMWRMLWKDNCTVIVLLSLTAWREKLNCVQYWPELQEKLRIPYQDGDLVIKLKLCHREKFYEKRVFAVIYKKGKKHIDERTVYQFHSIIWPEYGYPNDICGFIDLLAAVNRQLMHEQTRNQLVVQCSDNAGSSITFIAIDMLINVVKERGILCMIDIKDTVNMIKSNCSRGDQTVSQYTFIYLAIQHYIDTEKNRLNAVEICQRTPPSPDQNATSLPSRRNVHKLDNDEENDYLHPIHADK